MATIAMIPAAQYLRTSKRFQHALLEKQRREIAAYAQNHGYTIVKTYADIGKSGLTFKRRSGLNQLIQDVQSEQIKYRVILVQDISRWGRFQDIDEAAYYEFQCKNAGVPIIFCSELFADEKSLVGSILKTMKRNMAAEYSRELSVKSFAGQQKLAESGFRVGGEAGYGLRRMLVSKDGTRKVVLQRKQYKSIATDRIVLVPGPAHEVKCVRDLFRMVLAKKNLTEIVHILNKKQIPYRYGKPWSRYAVEAIVTNPKYMGCYKWNLTSRKMQGPWTKNPQSEHIEKPNAFQALVDENTFVQANKILPTTLKWSEAMMLDKLRLLLKRHGKISENIIAATPGFPSRSTYYNRLGSFRRIYEVLGYKFPPKLFDKVKHRQITFQLQNRLIARLADLFPQKFLVYRVSNGKRCVLLLDNGIRVAIRPCRRKQVVRGKQWRLYSRRPLDDEDLSLICLLNPSGTDFEQFYLLPKIDIPKQEHPLKQNDCLLLAGKKLPNLSQFYAYATSLAIEMRGKRRRKTKSLRIVK